MIAGECLLPEALWGRERIGLVAAVAGASASLRLLLYQAPRGRGDGEQGVLVQLRDRLVDLRVATRQEVVVQGLMVVVVLVLARVA